MLKLKPKNNELIKIVMCSLFLEWDTSISIYNMLKYEPLSFAGPIQVYSQIINNVFSKT